jgi:adenine-specific DNA-methyltransferase
VQDYLLNKVTLLRIHCFDPKDLQFEGALITSVVIWIRNEVVQSENHSVIFSMGNDLNQAESRQVSIDELKKQRKWYRFWMKEEISTTLMENSVAIGDIFQVKRGVVTGDNKFFIISEKIARERQLPSEVLVPIIPSIRNLNVREIHGKEDGTPDLQEPLYLFTCSLSEDEIQRKYPTVWKYLQEGKNKNVHNGYICSHRTLWYKQEHRDPPLFLCTYMGRSTSKKTTPFEFILNRSRAIALNTYLLLYPKQNFSEDQIKILWQELQQLDTATLKQEGRVYGGGLYKLEPKELEKILIKLPNIF